MASKFFGSSVEIRHANLSPVQTKENAIFTDWMNKINEEQNKIASKAIYEKHLNWQKAVIGPINYDKALLEHLFNETLLKCTLNERKEILEKAAPLKKETFLQNIYSRLKTVGELITTEQFLRDGLVVVSVSFLMGSISYLLITQVAHPIIAAVVIATSTYLPNVMAAGSLAYQWRWPIAIGRFIITHSLKDDSKFKKWIMVPINLFLDCTLFIRIQMPRISAFYTYSIAKFANLNLKDLEERTIKQIKEHPWVTLMAHIRNRNFEAFKEAYNEKNRMLQIDEQLGNNLVQLRAEWIANATG